MSAINDEHLENSNREEGKFSIFEHLGELRRRLVRSLIAVGITTTISFFFAKYVFKILESRAEGINLVFTKMTGMIGIYCKVALFCGIALATPIIIYEFVMFIHPALTSKEKNYLYFLLPCVILALVAGVAFGFYVLVPPAAHFLITFGSDIATPLIDVENFVSVIVRLLFAIGLCFETPLIIFFLSKIGVITPKTLSKYRKVAVIAAFVLGAIITPTFDPINQCLVAVPLIVLYEIGILLSKVAWRSKKQPIPSEVGTEEI
jgi:sec-independent protein translocase protein TatC